MNATRGEDGAITVSLADGGVTAAKIADATIGTDKLTENAVSSLKSIAAKSITADKLADGVIPSAPTWATLAGKPAAAAAKADLTAAPTAADVNAILAVLRAWGLIASK